MPATLYEQATSIVSTPHQFLTFSLYCDSTDIELYDDYSKNSCTIIPAFTDFMEMDRTEEGEHNSNNSNSISKGSPHNKRILRGTPNTMILQEGNKRKQEEHPPVSNDDDDDDDDTECRAHSPRGGHGRRSATACGRAAAVPAMDTTDCNTIIHRSEENSLQQETTTNLDTNTQDDDDDDGDYTDPYDCCTDEKTNTTTDNDDVKSNRSSTDSLLRVSEAAVQPTPIDEETKLHVVQKLPLLSEPLLAESQFLSQMLQPFQDENMLLLCCADGGNDNDGDADAHSMTISSSDSDRESSMESADEDKKQRPSIETPFISSSLRLEREALNQMLLPLQNNSELSSSEGIMSCGVSASAAVSGEMSLSAEAAQNRIQGQNNGDGHDQEGGGGSGEDHQGGGGDQYDSWTDRYNELLAYVEEHGDCNVPYHYAANPKLSHWVKRQRHHYRLKQRGEHSHLLDERQMLLDDAGFVWDSRASNWENRLEELKAFRETFGHVRVSVKDTTHRNLAVWLKRQRRNARKLQAGDRSTGMTE